MEQSCFLSRMPGKLTAPPMTFILSIKSKRTRKRGEMVEASWGLRTAAIAAIMALSLCAGPSPARAEAVVGKITQVTGKGQVERGGATLDAAPAMPVELHDRLKTAVPGEITLQMLDSSVL